MDTINYDNFSEQLIVGPCDPHPTSYIWLQAIQNIKNNETKETIQSTIPVQCLDTPQPIDCWLL